MTSIVTLSDGRNLAYEEYGDPQGTPVLSFHGCPSSRLDAAPAHPAALSLGIRLISPDRPGIGRSTYQPHRRLLDWPDDVAQLTEALGIERFAAMGWSSGGPYAAGCAARMKERVTNVALLSSAVPLDIYGTMRGLSSDDRILLFLVRRVPRLASALMRVTIADASDALLLRELRRSFPAVDRAVQGRLRLLSGRAEAHVRPCGSSSVSPARRLVSPVVLGQQHREPPWRLQHVRCERDVPLRYDERDRGGAVPERVEAVQVRGEAGGGTSWVEQPYPGGLAA